MRKELRQIEATLAQLADQPHQTPVGDRPLSAAATQVAMTQTAVTQTAVTQTAVPAPLMPSLRAPSFDTRQRSTSQSVPCRAVLPAFVVEPLASNTAVKSPVATAHTTVNSSVLPAALKAGLSPGIGTAKAPTLPLLHSADLNSQASTVLPLPTPPVPALDALKAIAAAAVGWQDELQAVSQQMQALYAEGPIVDGWLEPDTIGDREVQPGQRAETKHLASDVNRSSDVNSHDGVHQDDRPSLAPHTPTTSGETTDNYRLCGFNDDGQLWFRPCPAEQIAAVRLAVSRYERLKHCLARKQALETQLDQLAEALAAINKTMPASREHDAIA